ncbi:uncharacterized protein HKW66_Vig0143920 [Vigna angularis]|uniref:Uncharacterized protein n=1 Tax=Phaseolus angularis TaxID=3914 RepID=A0A8T0KEP0_PHAAN|nr:uncharacterized protein HKW66_Vig0143920 [Vigna angularis]
MLRPKSQTLSHTVIMMLSFVIQILGLIFRFLSPIINKEVEEEEEFVVQTEAQEHGSIIMPGTLLESSPIVAPAVAQPAEHTVLEVEPETIPQVQLVAGASTTILASGAQPSAAESITAGVAESLDKESATTTEVAKRRQNHARQELFRNFITRFTLLTYGFLSETLIRTIEKEAQEYGSIIVPRTLLESTPAVAQPAEHTVVEVEPEPIPQVQSVAGVSTTILAGGAQPGAAESATAGVAESLDKESATAARVAESATAAGVAKRRQNHDRQELFRNFITRFTLLTFEFLSETLIRTIEKEPQEHGSIIVPGTLLESSPAVAQPAEHTIVEVEPEPIPQVQPVAGASTTILAGGAQPGAAESTTAGVAESLDKESATQQE